MRFVAVCAISLAVLGLANSCTSRVETTDDATQVEVQVPKVEVGEQPVDLDPTTDGDVDIDTPAPGDQ